MKKLTLTFCALFVVFAAAPAIYADGPEQYSGKKEVMQPAPPVCDLYRAHEWDLGIWGAYAFAADQGRINVPNDDPFSTSIDGGPFFKPDFDPGVYEPDGDTISQPRVSNPNEHVNIGRVSKGELFGGRDDVFGGGVDVKYFWSRYFGAGIEGIGLAAKTNFAGGGLGTLTVRYPFGRFAPYAFGGVGVIAGGGAEYKFFNEKSVTSGADIVLSSEREFWTEDVVPNRHARFLGQLGVGLEYRITCHIGLMADFAWNFVAGRSNSADKFKTITEQGQLVTLDNSIEPLRPLTVISTAPNLVPGTGSDNQDFGLVRFGVTFSY